MVYKKLNYLAEAGFSIRFISFHFTLVCACACVCQDTNCYCCYFHTNHIPNTNTMLHNETLLADTKGISKHMIESMKSSCHILIGKKGSKQSITLHPTSHLNWRAPNLDAFLMNLCRAWHWCLSVPYVSVSLCSPIYAPIYNSQCHLYGGTDYHHFCQPISQPSIHITHIAVACDCSLFGV